MSSQRRLGVALVGFGWMGQAHMPFGRLIKPPEIARTIVHLATAEWPLDAGAQP